MINRKIFFVFINILFFQITISQNIMINYRFSIVDTKDEYGIIGFSEIKLVSNNFNSISYSRNIDTLVVIKDIEEPHYQEASSFNVSSYKKFIEGEKYSKTLFSKYYLKDQYYSIKWQITNNEKTILGYNCKEAIGNYRGRDYKVFFTTEIPIQNGPDSFDNLPGLILEVSSDDNVVKYIATEIKENDEEIYNPFTDKEYISWEEFKMAYRKYFNKMINYKPEEDMTIVVPNRGVELYLE